MTGKHIQQQIYTRERGGIFHDTDGYDTIAISKGLDKAFVKKYLHPFCIYHAPKTLTERGEKDTSLFPKAVTIFRPETGDLVIGQAVFVPADFTGTRSTYFMHNYIIPPGLTDEWVKLPVKLFQLKDFNTSYDVELGKILPEREVVEYDETDILSAKDELLEKLGVSEAAFKQLLFAVMSSIAGKKKVFISLSVPLEKYSTYALQLLELLYQYLPYPHRRLLGALTFTSVPESKNYIHVTFFEPGTLNITDRSIEKQFIFDFAGGRISGVNLEGQQHEYLNFCLRHFSEAKRIDDFLDFAEMALAGLPDAQKLELTSYYQLTDIFLTLTDNETLFYPKNKIGFLNSLLKFLQVNSDKKQELVELYSKRLTKEKLAADPGQALDYIGAVVSINKIVSCDEAHYFLLNTLVYYQNNRLFHQLWKVIEQDRPTYQALLKTIIECSDYEGLLELHLDERFEQVVRVDDILTELKMMLGSPYLLSVERFKSVTIKKMNTVITFDSFKDVLAIKDFSIEQTSKEFSKFKNDMLTNARIALLRSLRLNELTLQDIRSFGKIFTKGLTVQEIWDLKAKQNYQITHALYELISDPIHADTYSLGAMTGVGREQLRSTLQQLLGSHPTYEHFPLLFIAYATEQKGVDFQSLLEHLSRYSDDKTVLSFIRANSQLIETDLTYKRSLRNYLISHPESIWKNKTLRKELKQIKNGGLKNLLKEIEMETANPLIKFLKQYNLD